MQVSLGPILHLQKSGQFHAGLPLLSTNSFLVEIAFETNANGTIIDTRYESTFAFPWTSLKHPSILLDEIMVANAIHIPFEMPLMDIFNYMRIQNGRMVNDDVVSFLS